MESISINYYGYDSFDSGIDEFQNKMVLFYEVSKRDEQKFDMEELEINLPFTDSDTPGNEPHKKTPNYLNDIFAMLKPSNKRMNFMQQAELNFKEFLNKKRGKEIS